MPLQHIHQIPEETAVPLSPSSARLSDTAETFDATQNIAVAELLEAAENAEQKRRAVFRVYYALSNSVVVLLAGILLAMVAVAAGLLSPRLQTPIWICWIATLALNMICTQGMKWNWLARLDRAVFNATAKLLAAPNETRRILPFVDSLWAGKTPDERGQMYPALTELLWNLSASDATLLLDTPRRTALRNALMGSYTMMANFRRAASDGHFDDATADLAVAIMKTLASIGDKKSVKALQKIINADAKTSNDTVVRDAAREYLPVLMQKIDEHTKTRIKIKTCLTEQIRDPQKVLGEYLDKFSPQATTMALVSYLQTEQNSNASAFPYIGGGAIFFSFLSYGLFHSQLATGDAVVLLVATFLLCNLLLIAVFSARLGYSREARRIAYELCSRGGSDIQLLPFLINYAKGGVPFNGKRENDIAQKAIARLLPLLQPGDAALVPPAQRAYLRSWLKLPRRKSKKGNSGGKGNTSQTLAILALNALATIGDTKALPAAEAIARRTTRGNYHEADLQEAALRCVDALRMRKD